MLQDMIHPPKQQQQLPIEDLPSPISGPIFCFSDTDLFSDDLQSFEITSSNCCYEENSSYGNNLTIPLPPNIENLINGYQDNNGSTNSDAPTATSSTISTTTTAATAAATSNNNCNDLSIIFDSSDEIDNGVSAASINFSQLSPSFSVDPPFLTQQDQFDLSLMQSQIQLVDNVVAAADGLSQYITEPVTPFMGSQISPFVLIEDCLSYNVPLNPSSPNSCSFLGPPAMASFMPAASSADSFEIFAGNILMGSELQPQDLEYQGDNARIFDPDSMQRVLNPGDLQALSSDSQQLVGRAITSTPLASEILSLEDSTFNKVGKLSVEQRKEKILRYMKKRNERNFNKKIKYACRKTLADSRPRVRGRFAKNYDFGETPRRHCSNHEEEDDDDEVVVKEEENMVDSSHNFAPFKCNNYPIQSWI